MNKKLGLAVAGAVLAFGASTSASAGITIPAGDWTVDIGGNVNAFYTHTKFEGYMEPNGSNTANVVQTGLLPSALGIGAKTRQNDLDIAVQFTFFTGVDSGGAASSVLGLNNSAGLPSGAAGSNTLNIRQAFMTFGDASWGQVKMGRDLGVFGSDAILSDMTLLGVGVGAGAGGSSTLGRIGSGYVYADWVGQIQYQSPNWNGLQFTAAVREPWTNLDTSGGGSGSNGGNSDARNEMGYEGKVTYDFAANDVTGRVWASAITQKHTNNGGGYGNYTSRGFDIGAKVAYQGFGLVGYYYDGRGLDGQGSFNYSINGRSNWAVGGLMFLNGQKSKDSGGYVQATYVIPGVGTKLGASWGQSNSQSDTSVAGDYQTKNESWMVGAYHPLTKSLNLVAEYTEQEVTRSWTGYGEESGKAKTMSLGAILFF